MKNPSGPYPGRQLFLGLTSAGQPCFAYFISGRSPESRQRKAVQVDNSIRITPLGNAPYDPLRHYSALIYDTISGLATLSNGIQTEAIHETYRLMFNTGSPLRLEYMEKLMDGAGAEPDSYHTPRIAGLITPDSQKPALIIGLKTFGLPARVQTLEVNPGNLIGISTYRGSLDKPEARQPDDLLARLEFKWSSAEELAHFIFDISAALSDGNDIRVASIGGIRTGQNWQIAIWNAY